MKPSEQKETMGDLRVFMEMCRDGDIDGVEAAIDNGADVNEADGFGVTGLMYALEESHNNVVQLLLQHPLIDINKVDRDGWSALHYAVVRDNHEGLAALLARHDELTTSINQRNRRLGRSPIMIAVSFNKVNCFHLLLTHPLVDLDTRDNHQRTPQEVRG